MIKRPIDQIIIHCSATPNGDSYYAKDIDDWHAARGFGRDPDMRKEFNPHLQAIGYHYVILLDGITQAGRAEHEVGSHVFGRNARSIGICMIGTDKFTPAQWRSLRFLVFSLIEKYPRATVHGHREFTIKECPGFDVGEWMRNRNAVGPIGHVMVLQ